MAGGNTTYADGSLAIGVCDRCKMKRPYRELVPDGDKPGLRVCGPQYRDGCWDVKDPWKLPPPPPDQITLRYPRPDTDIAIYDSEPITGS